MAEAVEQQLAAPAERRRPLRRRGSYGGRFLVAYAVLALIATAAVAAAVVLLTGDPPAETRWSQWEPSAAGAGRAEQIAAHVGPRYRLPDGSQVAAVLAGTPSLPISTEQSLNVTHVALVTGEGESERIPTHAIGEQGVVYRLCGLGDNCALASGTPDAELMRLLRREALELALYSFAHLEETETVVVVLPQPPTAETPAVALLFERRDLENELQVPLAATLPEADSGAPVSTLDPAEARKVDRLTLTRLFQYEYRLTPDASGFVLVLAPAAAA